MRMEILMTRIGVKNASEAVELLYTLWSLIL